MVDDDSADDGFFLRKKSCTQRDQRPDMNALHARLEWMVVIGLDWMGLDGMNWMEGMEGKEVS